MEEVWGMPHKVVESEKLQKVVELEKKREVLELGNMAVVWVSKNGESVPENMGKVTGRRVGVWGCMVREWGYMETG